MRYHVFISYARKDNLPRRADGKGWVHLFKRRLEAQYLAATGRDLKVYLDEERIENGDHWETSIKDALRQSRILIAVLSPNYLASSICRMEIEEYIRHEQAATPGGEGVRPVYFATVPELEGTPSAEGDQSRLISDLNRRNRDVGLNWCDWAQQGVEALLQIEAEDRLVDLKANPEPPLDQFVAGIRSLQEKISARLNDVALGDLARGQGNLSASHIYFVGRSAEIASIHSNLISNSAQVITALHGLGGQGKSALARQYAHAFASYYAAGGRWEVECEGLGTGLSEESREDRFLLLALAFDRLIERVLIRDPGDDPRYRRLKLSDEQQRLPSKERLRAILARLQAFAVEGWDDRLATLRAQVGEVHGDWPQVHQPRMLVIFDNVDSPGLLNAAAYAELASPDWLEMIVTTRLDPSEIGAAGGKASIAALAVDHLPESDAVALLREMIDRAATSRPLPEEERKALRDLARVLGGFTLAVELAGAYLATYPKVTVGAYLERLRSEGIATIDSAVTDGSRKDQVVDMVRHREGQVGLVLGETLEHLPAEDVDVLHLASHFAPDFIVEDWLQDAAASLHPQFGQNDAGRESPWDATLARLAGRRLLVPSDRSGMWRLHRMVREHLRQTASSERLDRGRDTVIRLTNSIVVAIEDDATGWLAKPVLWQQAWAQLGILTNILVSEGAPDDRLLVPLRVLAEQSNQGGSIEVAQLMVEQLLALAKALVSLSPQSFELRRELSLAQVILGEFHKRKIASGSDSLTLLAYEAALEILLQLEVENPESDDLHRDGAMLQINLGELFEKRGAPGDLERAQKAYEAALKSFAQLTEGRQSPFEGLRDLSVAQNKLGKLYGSRGLSGDPDLELQAYEAALGARRKIAADNPRSAEALRNLSISLSNVGDHYLKRGALGDNEVALSSFEAALEAFRLLVLRNPKDRILRRDLSVAHLRIGEFHLKHGGVGAADVALNANDAALEIRWKLYEEDPMSSLARRDLSVALCRAGMSYEKRGLPGDSPKAIQAYEAALYIHLLDVKDNPMNAQARRDLSGAYGHIGGFHLRQGGQSGAEQAVKAFVAALEIDIQLVNENPESSEALRDLMMSNYQLGCLAQKTKNLEVAESYLKQAYGITEYLVSKGWMMDPQSRAVRAHLGQMFVLPPTEGEG